MDRTKLSAVVKALRKEYGLTQEDLALKSGVAFPGEKLNSAWTIS